MGTPRNLGNRTFAMRVRLNPDRMRAHNLSSEDIMKAFSGCSIVGSPGPLVQATGKTVAVEGVRADLHRALQQAGAVCKHHFEGDARRRDPAAQGCWRGGVGPQLFDIDSDVDGHPSAAIVLKQAPGSNAAEVIEAVKKELEQIKEGVVPSRHEL